MQMNRRLFTNSMLLAASTLQRGISANKDAHGATTGSLTVDTQFGKVRGASVRGVNIFRGIPYGGPTEDSGRFLPPSKPANWAGIRDATETGPRCVQSPAIYF